MGGQRFFPGADDAWPNDDAYDGAPGLPSIEDALGNDELAESFGEDSLEDAPGDEEFGLALYESGGLMAVEDAALPVTVIKGKGRPAFHPFLRRRERPLTMRLVVVTVSVCILATGLFAVTPLASGADASSSPLQALAGLVANNPAAYHWYTVQWGDTVESIAAKFHVQVAGIYELNNLSLGQELTLGQLLKIPVDPNYGKGYNPPALPEATNGQRYGNNWWNSIAGTPPPETPCGPDGKGVPTAYKLQPPNWGAAWVRGFIVWPNGYIYHTGVDLAAPYGNPIRAAQAGQVIWAGYDATNGLGWSVKIDNCNGVSTVYGHMAKLLVSVQQTVQAQQIIGLEGSTGNSTGPHLHFMVEWHNQYVDPMPYYSNSECAITKNAAYC